MPKMSIDADSLDRWGQIWYREDGSTSNEGRSKKKRPNRFDKAQGIRFEQLFDDAFGRALAEMLGGINVIKPKSTHLTASNEDCVETGTTRIIGGIRAQNFDAAYRPDGARAVFDSKTLNDDASIRKNWQNNALIRNAPKAMSPRALNLAASITGKIKLFWNKIQI